MSSVADILRRKLPKYAEQVAIKVDGGRSLTYGDLDAASSRVANWLIAKNLKPGDRLAVAFSNADGDRFLTVYFGAHKAGIVFVPLSPRATAKETTWIVEHCGARLVLGAADVLAPWRAALSVETLSVEAAVFTDGYAASSDEDPLVPVAPDDVADIMYTSGTTGTPKGVEVTDASLTQMADEPFIMLFGGKPFLHPVPLHTFAGNTFMLFCVRYAMTNVLMSKFDPRRFAELLAQEKIFSVYAVSPMWLLMLKEVRDLDRRDFSHVAMLQFGAAAMPASAVLRLCEVFPKANVTNLYGLTEGGTAGCMMPPGQAKLHPSSVGKPLATSEVAIVDDAGQPLPVGDTGEIWLRNKAGASRRYYRDDKATGEAWHSEGWLKTGDVGYVDAEGYVYLVDRKKDIVIRGGYNIASLEVEDALFRHPDVKAAAVIGIPHPELGEDLVACIVPQDDSAPDAEALRAFLLAELSDYKVPRRYEFVAGDLPRNPMGKVLKRELRERYAKGA